MIYEKVEDEDFIEIILHPNDIPKIEAKGVVKNFPDMINKNTNLNLYVRLENTKW